jgi:hypothetical protein
MIKLAKLAMQNKKAQEMEYLVFDTAGVDDVEEALLELESIPSRYNRSDDEEALEVERDRHHCDEVWRNLLLLYIARVF